MTEKRFKLRLSKLGNGMITDTQKREDLFFDKEFLDATLPKTAEWLNELAEDNEQLKKDCGALICHNQEYRKENEQLKKRLLEIAYYFRNEVTRNDLDDKDFEELRRLSKIYFDGVD